MIHSLSPLDKQGLPRPAAEGPFCIVSGTRNTSSQCLLHGRRSKAIPKPFPASCISRPKIRARTHAKNYLCPSRNSICTILSITSTIFLSSSFLRTAYSSSWMAPFSWFFSSPSSSRTNLSLSALSDSSAPPTSSMPFHLQQPNLSVLNSESRAKKIDEFS